MTEPAQPRARAHVVDAVRGLACVWMIEWHTADSWLEPGLRGTAGFTLAERVGGIAAPWFFLLAGVASGLTEAQSPEKRRAALPGALRRAGQIVVLGYALKLFGLAVDRGGLVDGRAPAVVLGVLGLACLHQALGPGRAMARGNEREALDSGLGNPFGAPERLRGARHRVALAVLGAGGFAAMLFWLRNDSAASELVLRLDVLQGIGAALSLVALVLWVPVEGRARVLLPLGLALVVAICTPALSRLDLTPPPSLAPLVDYVARLAPYPAPSGARFPLFPWLGYALLGAGVGRAMRGQKIGSEFGLPRAESAGAPAPLHAALVLVLGFALAALAFEESPAATAILGHTELARNLLRLTHNASLAAGSAAAVFLVSLADLRSPRALALLGRHSLVVYAVHLEIAYGLPTVPLMHTLGWGTWLLGAAVLASLMGALAHGLEAWDRRGRTASTARAESQVRS